MLPKYHGTRHLSKTFDSQIPSLDFFIMLSSLSGILGIKSQANYAAGSVFQDYFAHSKADSPTRYLSIDLGMVEQTRIMDSYSKQRSSHLREGLIPLKLEQVLNLVEYCISQDKSLAGKRQIVTGFSRESLSRQNCQTSLRNLMFDHLPYKREIDVLESSAPATSSLDCTIACATDIDQVNEIVATAMMQQLAMLVATDLENISLDSSMVDLGLDSLIAIEMRNWMNRNLQVEIEVAAITDAKTLRALVVTAMENSKLVDLWQNKSSRDRK